VAFADLPLVLLLGEHDVDEANHGDRVENGSSAPLVSSQLALLSCPEPGGGLVVQGLVWAVLVVPPDPASVRGAPLGEPSEGALADKLLFEAAEEAVDQPVLLGGLGRDELLRQPVIPAGGAEAAALEDQAVVGTHDRSFARRSLGCEAPQAVLRQRTFRLIGTIAKSQLVADDLSVMAVDDRGEVLPAIGSTRDVGDIHGTVLTAHLCATRGTRDARPSWTLWLMHQPAVDLEDAMVASRIFRTLAWGKVLSRVGWKWSPSRAPMEPGRDSVSSGPR